MKAVGGILPIDQSPKKNPKRRTQWLKQLRGIKAQLSSLLRRLSQLEEIVDAAELECEELLSDIETSTAAWLDAGSDNGPVHRNRHGRKSGKAAVESLKRLAAEGVWFFKLVSHFDGYAEIYINDAKPLKLTPALAELISILAADRGRSPDGLVAWKPIKEVAEILGKKSGAKMSDHSVNQRISRLRDRLEQNDINPYFVQTNRRRREIRFALKRDEGARTPPGPINCGA